MPGARVLAAEGYGDIKLFFPQGPDWTLLLGSGSDIPQPTQGKTLTVLEVDDLFDPVSKFDGNVQTLGLGMADPEKEEKLALLAGKKGVDRIVKLGRMHVFVPPWDGVDLIRPDGQDGSSRCLDGLTYQEKKTQIMKDAKAFLRSLETNARMIGSLRPRDV